MSVFIPFFFFFFWNGSERLNRVRLTKYNGGRSDLTGGSLVGPADKGIGAGFKRLVSNAGGWGRGKAVCRK